MLRSLLAAAAGMTLAATAVAGGIPDLPVTATTVNEGYEVSWDPNPASPHYFPTAKAFAAALALDRDGASGPGNPRGYHEGYINALLLPAYFSDPAKPTFIYDCKDDDGCDNGWASVSNMRLPTTVYATASDSCIGMIMGHELFHHVEFAYSNALGGSGCGGIWGNTVCEGQARAMQDKIFSTLDLFPQASCIAPYLGQVNGYLNDTNQSIWLASYDAALWWVYLMEQYGVNPTEPGLGIDFITLWWGRALAAGLAGADALAITDATIKLSDPGDSVFNAFRHFAMANLIKDFDLSSNSAAFVDRYSYRDETLAGEYSDVKVEFDLGSVAGGQSITQLMGVQYFGSRYLKADVSNCPTNKIIRVEIDAANTAPSGAANTAGYGIVFVRNDQPKAHYKKFDVDWTLSTFQPSNRYDEVYLVVAPIAGFWVANVTVSCQSPQTTLDLDFPLTGGSRPVYGGASGQLAAIQVSVFPTETGPNQLAPVSGLTAVDFSAAIGGTPAQVLTAIPDGAGYQLLIHPPDPGGDGTQDLQLEVGGTVQLFEDAVIFGERPETEVILAVDMSTSMLVPPDGPRLEALRVAGRHFVDLLPGAAQLGLVSFRGDGTEPNDDASVLLPLAAADDTQRNRMRVALDNLATAGGFGSAIGDGVQAGYNMFAADGVPVRSQHLVLVVDGPEDDGAFWTDLRDTVINAGIVVHTVALGPLADQELLSEIATSTGGEFRYADVRPLETDVLDLYGALAQIADTIEGRLLVQDEPVQVEPGQTLRVDVPVAEALTDPGIIAVRAFNSLFQPVPLQSIGLLRPDGTLVTGRDLDVQSQINQSDATFLSALAKGTWQVELVASGGNQPAQVEVTLSTANETGLTASAGFFSLPEIGDEVLTGFQAGQRIGLGVTVAERGQPVAIETLEIQVESIDGSIWRAAPASMPDRSFGVELEEATDASLYQGWPVKWKGFSLDGKGTSAATEELFGAYNLLLEVGLHDGRRLILHEALHVRQQGSGDRDGDNLLDRYEDRHECLDGDLDDATADGDGDGLPNIQESELGTDPCREDTDQGGEIDGSEVARGRNPLDDSDDAMRRPLDGYVLTELSEHEPMAPLTPNAITLMLPSVPATDDVYIDGKIITAENYDSVAVLDLASRSGRRYVDTNVRTGQEYQYRFRAVAPDGATSASSPVVFGMALSDPEAPLGAVQVADLAPRQDGLAARVQNSLYNENPATTEYRRRLDDGDWSAWQSYQDGWVQTFPEVLVPTLRTVSVQYRDASGNVSTTYRDDLTQWPTGTLGGLTGVVRDSQGNPLQGALVMLADAPEEASAVTDAQGRYTLVGLVPGDYDLEVTRYQFDPGFLGGLQVAAGDIDEAPVLNLVVEGDNLFADGFESP